jgi:phage protein U
MNPSKSKVTGERLTIEELGKDKLRFSDGTESDTITVDGTDQPLQRGGTMALTKLGPNSIRMVIKLNGKVVSSMVHQISGDGQIQTIEGTRTGADGTKSDFKVETKRVGSGSGWSGTWESTKINFTRPGEWDISSYGSGGLSFYSPARKETLSMNFDGKDYASSGPEVTPGWTFSGNRADQQTIEISDKFKGEVVSDTRYQVSPDGKTLTINEHRHGQPNPLVFVYDKM